MPNPLPSGVPHHYASKLCFRLKKKKTQFA
jgi:hypothetical protein